MHSKFHCSLSEFLQVAGSTKLDILTKQASNYLHNVSCNYAPFKLEGTTLYKKSVPSNTCVTHPNRLQKWQTDRWTNKTNNREVITMCQPAYTGNAKILFCLLQVFYLLSINKLPSLRSLRKNNSFTYWSLHIQIIGLLKTPPSSFFFFFPPSSLSVFFITLSNTLMEAWNVRNNITYCMPKIGIPVSFSRISCTSPNHSAD